MEREEYVEWVRMNSGIKMNGVVECCNIEGIGYEKKKKELWVGFKGKKV